MLTGILLRQIMIMFLLTGAGCVLFKLGYITKEGSRDLGAILLRVVIPCVIIRSFLVEYSFDKLTELGASALLAFLSHLIAIAISAIAFRGDRRIESFASTFCNAGFIGIPLTQAVFGDHAVFYIAAYVAFLNLFQWTYGVFILTRNPELIRGAKLLWNPVVISTVAGLLFFVLPFELPGIITSAIGLIANITTPLAMIILGVYLGGIHIRDMVLDKRAYPCVFFRLVVIPLLTLGILRFIPVSNAQITMVVLIAASTPVGSNIVIYAQQYESDSQLAVKMVCLSTILSVITVPLFFSLAQLLII